MQWTAIPEPQPRRTLTVVRPLNSTDPSQLFRVEDVGDNWVAINSLIQWEAKINVYGSDVHGTIGMWGWDGGDNEKWRLVEETGQAKVTPLVADPLNGGCCLDSLTPRRISSLNDWESPLTLASSVDRRCSRESIELLEPPWHQAPETPMPLM